jgi:hypothetical protein
MCARDLGCILVKSNIIIFGSLMTNFEVSVIFEEARALVEIGLTLKSNRKTE